MLRIPSAKLKVAEGPDAGKSVAVETAPVLIGKDPTCELVLTDPSVSRRHAVLTAGANGFWIEDLGSTNGTEINGVVVKAAMLPPGARLRVGDTILEFAPVERKIPSAPWLVDRLEGLVGSSPGMRELYGLIRQVAPTDATVVFHGETGSGKEVAARALHALSSRKSGPFVVVDCANLDRELVGSELFGHRKGAFTGAVGAHKGAFERAQGGTVFLDEIGELPADMQARLLGVLQRREVQPLGADAPVPVDVRVLAATHRDLETMSRSNTFREDLYFRLAVFTLTLPPLRDRLEDMPAIARQLLIGLAAPGTTPPELTNDALLTLAAHDWRGNVRELGNVLHRASVLAAAGPITREHLRLRRPDGAPVTPAGSSGAVPPALAASGSYGPGGLPAAPPNRAGSALADAERQAITEAFGRLGGNLVRTAKELGIARTTLRRKLREYGLYRGDDND